MKTIALIAFGKCVLQIWQRNLARSRYIDQCAERLGHRYTVDLFDSGRRQVGHVEDDGFGDSGAASERFGHSHVEPRRHPIG